MKNSILLVLLATFCITASCQQNAKEKIVAETSTISKKNIDKNVQLPIMSFSETTHDFGIINEGDVVEHEFLFTNTGEAPLVITNAKGSCGCTVPKWPSTPIQPGDQGTLLVRFNSNGKPNMQTKQITITANTKKSKETLKIKAMVTPKSKS